MFSRNWTPFFGAVANLFRIRNVVYSSNNGAWKSFANRGFQNCAHTGKKTNEWQRNFVGSLMRFFKPRQGVTFVVITAKHLAHYMASATVERRNDLSSGKRLGLRQQWSRSRMRLRYASRASLGPGMACEPSGSSPWARGSDRTKANRSARSKLLLMWTRLTCGRLVFPHN